MLTPKRGLRAAELLSRVLISGIFIAAGIEKARHRESTERYMKSKNLPLVRAMFGGDAPEAGQEHQSARPELDLKMTDGELSAPSEGQDRKPTDPTGLDESMGREKAQGQKR